MTAGCMLKVLSVAFAPLVLATGTATADSAQSHLHAFNATAPCASRGQPPDASLAVCGMTFGVTRLALSSQSVILVVGDAESSHADCANGFAATTHSWMIDGNEVPITVDHCRYIPPNDPLVNPFFRGAWAVAYKNLIKPGALTAGSHTVTFTTNWIHDQTYSLGCTDPSGRCTIPAGSVEIDTGQLIIQ